MTPEIMTRLKELQTSVKAAEDLLEEKKGELSALGEEILKLGATSFEHKGEWFSVKRRAGKCFIVSFGNKKPGSWLGKKEKAE